MDSIKFLHNLKLKLKGNIRVFCRIRPIIQSDLDHINKRMAKDYMPSSIVSKQRMIEIRKKDGVIPTVEEMVSYQGNKKIIFN